MVIKENRTGEEKTWSVLLAVSACGQMLGRYGVLGQRHSRVISEAAELLPSSLHSSK